MYSKIKKNNSAQTGQFSPLFHTCAVLMNGVERDRILSELYLMSSFPLPKFHFLDSLVIGHLVFSMCWFLFHFCWNSNCAHEKLITNTNVFFISNEAPSVIVDPCVTVLVVRWAANDTSNYDKISRKSRTNQF